MPVYTVHEPPRKEGEREDDAIAHSSRFVFVRDGFHFWAFLLAPLWMLRHRMWLELIAWLLLLAGITFALQGLGVAESAGFAVALLLPLLVGMEASSLRRWKLSRRGFASLGVVVGDDLENAERRFFDGWTAQNEPPARTPPSPPPSQSPSQSPSQFLGSSSSDIVGLFPQPETRP